jgi:predicted nucleotidyltransferase
MTRADPFSLTDRPEIAGAYVFGSFLHKADPDDIDVLLIYREEVCPPCKARDVLRQLVSELEVYFGVKLHLTLLSDKEIAHNGFIGSTGCISLQPLGHDTQCTDGLH